VSPWSSPAATAVENGLFRALAVLRVVVLANTVVLSLLRADRFERPFAGAAALGAMVLWTAFVTWAYAQPRRRSAALLVTDLGLALALVLATPWVKGDDVSTSLPGFWVIGALVAWAVHYRTIGGLVAGVLLAAADLARQDVDGSDYGNAFLLVMGGAMLGFMCGLLQRTATERDAAERAAAAAAERARLARAVHDGVLQVLAMVNRRGQDLDGELADLGRLAGEQERRLRALIRAEEAVDVAGGSGTVDLVAELARLERSAAVTVSAPAFPVEVPAAMSRELVAAAGACLDNVRRHVGDAAPAWVLLEAFPDRVELSVRDEGPGIPAGRLDEAAAQGRLGVVESIRGRVAGLGGTTRLVTGAFGTEWELVVPRVADGRGGS
jgi:signal transduction histidine kinase